MSESRIRRTSTAGVDQVEDGGVVRKIKRTKRPIFKRWINSNPVVRAAKDAQTNPKRVVVRSEGSVEAAGRERIAVEKVVLHDPRCAASPGQKRQRPPVEEIIVQAQSQRSERAAASRDSLFEVQSA